METPLFDTARIAEIYMARPVSAITMSLGAWFTLGAGIKDEKLKYMEGQQAKIYIINAGYNTGDGLLARLYNFNRILNDD